MYRVEDSYWWYRGMRKMARTFVPELFRLGPQARLLDAGCGTGANLAHVRSEGSEAAAVGIDLSFDALRFCRKRGLKLLVCGSAEALPFRSGVFDAATCHDLLYTVPRDEVALAELFRVAKERALVYVTAAAFDWLRGEQDRATHGLRRYTEAGMRERLARAGFTLERASYANMALVLPVFIVRRLTSIFTAAPKDGEALSEFHVAGGPMNGLLAALLGLEARIAAHVSLPVGSTLVVRVRKS